MQWELSKAYEFVKQKRPCVSPNLHFMGQLLEFQKQLQLSGSQEQMEHQSSEEDTEDSVSVPTLDCVDTPCLYYDISLHNYGTESQCTHSVSLPSASAPSSLNFDTGTSFNRKSLLPIMDIEKKIQVIAESPTTHRPAATKPKTLPLMQARTPTPPIQRSVQSPTYTSRPVQCRLKKGRQISSSLPSTPTTAPQTCRNHLSTLSPLSQPSRFSHAHPLLHSPCRLVAQLGSRSESCLNYGSHTSLAESM